MDNEELVSYYLKRSQDWIFIPQFRTVKIEDDEILDLDSMNLDSNEDTWLCSSSEKSSVLKDSSQSMEHEELEKEFGSSGEVDSKKEKIDVSSSPLSPLLGPEDFHHPSFLNSMDEMSDTAAEDLFHTPLTSRAKGNLLRKALANSHSQVESSNSSGVSGVGSVLSAGTTAIVGTAVTSPDDEADVVFKKPSSAPTNESVAKSYILHSVENKLFNLADVNSTAELIKSRDLKNAEIARKTAVAGEKMAENDVDALSHRFEELKTGAGGDDDADFNDENVLAKPPAPTYAWHSTPHQENVNKLPPRRSFPQQPTPILLNRYLKHKQHQAAEMNCMLSRHLDADDLDGETNGDLRCAQQEDEPRRSNEMNVSYVKFESEDSAKLPRIDNVSPTGLRSSFSKSDDVLNSPCHELNSTYGLRVEDDAVSSGSESSLSSMSHKLTLSIQEVQKMADQQERSLKKQVYTSYYAGSSKSSEVSSSNESVSTYGALSNSNEGSINLKPTPKIVKGIQPPKQRLSYARELPPTCNSKTNSRISTYSSGKANFQPSKLVNNVDVKPASATINETKANLSYKSRLSTANGQYSNTSHSPSRKTQALPTRPATVPPKPSMSVLSAPAENATVLEIKDTSANTTISGPASHIPRPASKIPMFRSGSSRTRFGKS